MSKIVLSQEDLLVKDFGHVSKMAVLCFNFCFTERKKNCYCKSTLGRYFLCHHTVCLMDQLEQIIIFHLCGVIGVCPSFQK